MHSPCVERPPGTPSMLPAGADGVAVAGLEIGSADPPAHGAISIPIGMCMCERPGCVRPGTLPGATATQKPSATRATASTRANSRAPGRHLLDEDREPDDAHPDQAHHSQCEEREHQAGTAAHADGAVLDTHLQRTEPAAAPAQEELQRRAAMAQAGGLERRQLVDAGDGERAPGDPRAVRIPGHESRVQRADAAIDRVGREPVGRPGEQVAGHERVGLHARRACARTSRSPAPPTAASSRRSSSPRGRGTTRAFRGRCRGRRPSRPSAPPSRPMRPASPRAARRRASPVVAGRVRWVALAAICHRRYARAVAAGRAASP